MRGKQAKKRKTKPDAVYNSKVVASLINNVMLDGKKVVAEGIVYKSFDILKKDLKKKPLDIIETAIENVKPKLEVKPRRVGGVNYQVPMPVSEQRQLSLAIKWIIQGARARRKKEEFCEAFAAEIKDAYKNLGFAVKKREDMYKMAEANKAFAHFQW